MEETLSLYAATGTEGAKNKQRRAGECGFSECQCALLKKRLQFVLQKKKKCTDTFLTYFCPDP